MIKRFLVALSVAILGAVGGLTVASPAQAVYSDCAAYNNVVCFHQHGNFTGTVWRQVPGQIINCRNLSPDNFNDKASTVFNRTDDYILYVYEHSNCLGDVKSLTMGAVRSFSSTDTWWNDRISSIYIRWVG